MEKDCVGMDPFVRLPGKEKLKSIVHSKGEGERKQGEIEITRFSVQFTALQTEAQFACSKRVGKEDVQQTCRASHRWSQLSDTCFLLGETEPGQKGNEES